MRTYFLFCLTSLLFGAGALGAEIVEVKSIKQLDSYLKPNTLVIFDIDNTLIEPVQSLGSDQWFEHRCAELEAEGIEREEALAETRHEWNAIQGITKVTAVEPETVALVARLQKEGYAVMGLTTRSLGMSLLTYNQLQKVGINLKTTAPTHGEVYTYNGRGVLFTDGVLYTAATDKGKAFGQFLARINLQPKRVLFINDKRSHLEQVETYCNNANIPFIGLRYGYLDDKVKAFSAEVVARQKEVIKPIPSDEEVRSGRLGTPSVADLLNVK